jgi:hypothetical protein
MTFNNFSIYINMEPPLYSQLHFLTSTPLAVLSVSTHEILHMS